MSRSKPTVVRLSEMKPGQLADCFVQLLERARGATRDGKPYYTCRFRDADRTVSCMIWADGGWYEACASSWREGQFYKVRVLYGEHERYGPQIELHNIRPTNGEDHADGFDPAEMTPRSRHNVKELFAELQDLAGKHIADASLRRLVLTLLERHGDSLQRLPATQRHFYPYPGGLLAHILSVTKTCLVLMERYAATYPDLTPPLNRDLVVAGAILHDLGRVVEFGDDILAIQPTVPGRMFGHILLARDLVRDTARELGDVNPELVQLLEHVIVTHLALPEWGSPRLPLVPECLILHHADDLDAKLEMYARCLTEDKEPGAFTARDPALGKPLFKGRSV